MTTQKTTTTESYILLNNLRFRAFHGVMAQEHSVGGDYTVSLRIKADICSSTESDDIADTLNYAAIYDVVRREMAVPSALVEHVAGRIGRAVLDEFPKALAADVTVVKLNPPMGAHCDGAGVELHMEREP